MNLFNNYKDLIEKVVNIRYLKRPHDYLDYDDYLSIANESILNFIKNKSEEELKKYNKSYITNLIKWAINRQSVKFFKFNDIINYDSIINEYNESIINYIRDEKINIEEDIEYLDKYDLVKEAIFNLKPRDRIIIECKFYLNYKGTEIAKLFKTTDRSICMKTKTIFKKIKKYLKENEQ